MNKKLTQHQAIIDAIVKKHGAKTGSLTNALCKHDPDYFSEYELCDYRPDAHLIQDDTVIVWEVEVTHPICPRQAKCLGLIEFELAPEYKLDLRVVDRYGNESQMAIKGSFLSNTCSVTAKSGYI